MEHQDVDREDKLARLLEAFDERLASAEFVPGDWEPLPDDLDPELLAQFDASKRCLLMLNSVCHGPRASAPMPPQMLGHYRILSELGRGSFGVVFLAEDTKLKRQVAVKVSHPSWLLSDAARQRFLREAEAAARLSHPQIVAIYEVGQAGQVAYIASEFCRGPNLEEWLAANPAPLPVREAAEFIASLAEAIQHAHARGVLHRDLKPSNIILNPVAHLAAPAELATASLGAFLPKIGDFGLAKIAEHDDLATRSGTVVGTLSYAAPEQAEGRLKDISVQSDVYSLGTILYRLLTGVEPFRAETYAETLQKVLFADPICPDRLRTAVPADLAAICLRCLEKSRARRYLSAADLAADLRRYCAGQPTLARPLSYLGQAWRWTRRHPIGAAQIAIAIGAAAAIVVGTAVQNGRLRAATDVANREMEMHQRLLYTANVRGAFQAWRSGSLRESVDFLSNSMPATDQGDLRGFAWHYLWNTLHCELKAIDAHQDDIYSIAFSPDGQQLATAGKDRVVRVWNVASGDRVCEFIGHRDEVNAVVFLPDGILASASDDGTIRLWDVVSGKPAGLLEPNDGRVFGLAATHDGKILAAGGESARLRIWDLATRAEVWSAEGPAVVESLSFSPDDRLLALGDKDGRFRCFDMAERKLVHEAQISDRSAISVAFSPNTPDVVIAGRSSMLGVYRRSANDWSVVGNEELDARTIGMHTAAFSPRNNMLASGNRDGTIQFWNVRPKLVSWRTLPGHTGRVWSLAWSPDGRVLASGGADGTVKIWNPDRPVGSAAVYPGFPAYICSLSFSPNQQTILAGGDDGRLRTWNRHTRSLERVSDAYPPGFTAGAYIGDDNATIAIAVQGGVNRWTIGGEPRAVDGISELVSPRSCALSPDGRLLAVGGPGGFAAITGADDLHLRRQFKSRALTVRCVAISADGRHLVTAGAGAQIEFWNTETGELEHLFSGHTGQTHCVAFSTDGKTIISGGNDQLVRVWNVASGKLQATLVGNSGEVSALAIAPDGKTLATGTNEPGTVKLFDLRSNSLLMNLYGPVGPVSALAFSPDGRTLIAGCSHPGFGHLLEWSLDENARSNAENTTLKGVRLRPNGLASRPSSPDAQSVTPMELIQAVNDHARRLGYAAGYPTFQTMQGEDGTTFQAVMLRGEDLQPASVSLDEFSDATGFPQTDGIQEAPLITSLLDATNRWAIGRGYAAALPSYSSVNRADEPLQFEIVLLTKSVKREAIAISELGDPADVPAVFQTVHAWAVKAGNCSAFPTFRLRGKKMDCVLIRPKSGKLVEIPESELLLQANP